MNCYCLTRSDIWSDMLVRPNAISHCFILASLTCLLWSAEEDALDKSKTPLFFHSVICLGRRVRRDVEMSHIFLSSLIQIPGQDGTRWNTAPSTLHPVLNCQWAASHCSVKDDKVPCNCVLEVFSAGLLMKCWWQYTAFCVYPLCILTLLSFWGLENVLDKSVNSSFWLKQWGYWYSEFFRFSWWWRD